MTEKAIVNDRFLRLHPEVFQKTVLVAVIKSYRFYTNVKEQLCPYDLKLKARRPDFQKLEYNRVFGLAADYWDQWSSHLDGSRDYCLTLDQLEELLRSEMNQGRLAQQDAINIFEALKLDYALIEFPEAVLGTFHKNALLHAWLNRRAATNLIDRVYNDRMIRPPTLEELKAIVDSEFNGMRKSDSQVVSGADLMFQQMRRTLPFPTDIAGVNAVTGGGFHPGTTTLVAGINGGGKTILAMQWAKHFAQCGGNVVVFTTEQPPVQLMVRALCNFLQIDFGRLTQADLTSDMALSARRNSTIMSTMIPEDVWSERHADITNFWHQLNSRLFFVDWSGQPMSLTSNFEAEMSKITATGWDPDVVVFDWIGGGLESLRGADGKVNLEIRHLYKEAIETLITHGKRTRRVMVAMAQLNKAEVGLKKKAVVMADLAECKSMTDNVTNFCGISALRDTNNSTIDTGDVKPTLQLKQFLNFDKARMGPAGLVPVEAVFRHQCFKGIVKNRL